ncbi:hypothetical protein AB0J80_27755 [Actinoplanes sp. NPDC049548]|uniref:hypothetical protein n=1 Tax=Actinoplanes sp. NPDC049548 TaxID=3155152 RepID=UPI00341D49FC
MSTETETGPQQSPPSGDAVVTDIPGQTRPARFSPDEVEARTTAAEQSTRPTLLPPSAEGAEGALAAAQAVTATWHTNLTVTAMWSINETRNAWINIQNVGWRKIYNGRDGAYMALVALAGQARQTGRATSMREEADAMIYEIYLW